MIYMALEKVNTIAPFLNVACAVHTVKINTYNQTYTHWHIHTPNAHSILVHVSALHGCHHQGVFTVVNPLNTELNPICHFLALLGARHFSTLAG